jgi:hypothetical protein
LLAEEAKKRMLAGTLAEITAKGRASEIAGNAVAVDRRTVEKAIAV